MKDATAKYSKTSWAWGRNGSMQCTGINLFPIDLATDPYVEVCPITSRGMTSGAVKIHIPFEDVDAVYNALGKIREEIRAHLTKSPNEVSGTSSD